MKKTVLFLFLAGFLVIPLNGIAREGMTITKSSYYLQYTTKHNLSDYSVCCWVFEDGNTYCVGKGWLMELAEPELGENLAVCYLIDRILTVGDWIFTAILVVAIIIFLFAAWNFLTSQGDPNKVKTARNYLIYAVIGIAVAFLAKVLVRVVASVMT